MDTLPLHQIDIWYLTVQDISAVHSRLLLAALPFEEQKKFEAFYFQHDRLRYLLTRTLLRTLLAFYTQIPPGALQFEQNAQGRPKLVSAQNNFNIDFNITHSESIIGCAFIRNGKIGIDIESYQHIRDLTIARDFFSPVEITGILSLPEELRNERFIEYWTLKEAFVKAIGKGMAIPLHEFYFDLRPNSIGFTDLKGHGEGRTWCFRNWNAPDRHLFSLAAASDAFPANSLQCKIRAFAGTEPLHGKPEIDWPVLRQSHR